MSTGRFLAGFMLFGAILAGIAPVAAASTPDVQSRYATAGISYGTASVGNSTLVVWKSGRATLSLGVKRLPYRKPANIWIYAGTCGHLGTRILVIGSQTPATTQLAVTFPLVPSQLASLTKALATGPISIIVGSKYRCGTFPSIRSCRPAALSGPPTWKVLVLVYTNAAFTYKDATGAMVSFASTMTDSEVATSRAAAEAMPATVNAWSAGYANVAVTVVLAPKPLSSVTPLPPGYVVVTADNVRADLSTLAPIGAYDSVSILWKNWNDQTDLPLPYAGMALGLDSRTGAEVLTNVLGRDWYGAWWTPLLLIHEWLHGVVNFFRITKGYAGPDVDGAAAYGYTPTDYFYSFYADFMTGQIKMPDGTLGGISQTLWRSGIPRRQPAAGCYLPFGTFLGF